MVLIPRGLRVWLVVAAFLGLLYLNLDKSYYFWGDHQALPFDSKNSDDKPHTAPSNSNPSSSPSKPNGPGSKPISDVSVHEIASTKQTAVAFPADYLHDSQDDTYCRDLYSSQYLEHIASHHIPYCEDGSKSTFECFRDSRNMTMCLAIGVLIDQTRGPARSHTAMHCQLRNFTKEAIEDPRLASDFYGVKNVDEMPQGFFDTGPPWQLKYWDVNTTDENMAWGSEKTCTPENRDGKWTLLVKRENHNNIWHKLMELWSAMVTLDVLQMAINPITGKPYLKASEITDVQVVFTEQDGGLLDGIDKWWDMVTGNTPIMQKDMAPTCLDKVILPLAGSFSPFWSGSWVETDCHDTFLLDAFLKRVYRHLGIQPEKHGNQTSETVVTIIDRKERRKLRNIDGLLSDAKARWPQVTFQLIDFANISLDEQVALVRKTDVLVGLTGAGLTHIFWLPEESSVAEIQAPNKRMPEAQPYTGFRNLAKMRNLHYFTAHPERREGDGEWDWQKGEWVDIKNDVFQALIDAAINAQIHKGSSKGEVLPRPLPKSMQNDTAEA